MANLNINCYDITDELSYEESLRGTSYIIQIPFKVKKLLNVIDNRLYAVVDIDCTEGSYVKLCYIPPMHDIKDIDINLNDNYNAYNYLGTYEVNTADKFVFLFARELTKEEERIIELNDQN